MKHNYQIILDKTIEALKREGKRPSLLLHACCAPCSSYVLEYLCEFFDITLLFYNPNITVEKEHELRYKELTRLVSDMGLEGKVGFADSKYEPERFFEIARGLENVPEGGERCKKCYALRLQKTAEIAAKGGFDYFTTTLSISPYKNAEWLNEIGSQAADKTGTSYLYSDFKKRGGYKRSCELSEEFGLYRQDFCGCAYSKAERERTQRS